MLKILFIGDIVGKIGRMAVAKLMPKLKKEYGPDLIIANAENSAHGQGVNEGIINELLNTGINWFTAGDHAFDQIKQTEIYKNLPIISPANFSQEFPGLGYAEIEVKGRDTGKKDHKILLINLIGRVFMKMDYDCPFHKIDEILAHLSLPSKKYSAIIVDVHAEATAEKIALKHYLDGRISALLGTHTHVMTADQEITKKGMAYISDVGMVGFADGCIGVDKENILKSFLTQMKYSHVIPEKGRVIFSAVLLAINKKNARAHSIKPIIKHIDIR
ncbi:YmdB family metallophosphoesterase [Patescibacteria group bacterium]